MSEFMFDVVILDNKNDVCINSRKKVYNTDGILNLPDWCKIKKPRTKEFPNGSSGISIKESNKKSYEDSIGYFVCRPGCAYNIFDSIMTIIQHEDGFIDITRQNYEKCMTAFCAKKVFNYTYINSQDQFLAPNESHVKFQKFQNDSIIYSLFDSSSQQTSLRNIQYHNKTWDIIRNDFFWCSNEMIKTLANQCNNDLCYTDCNCPKYSTDRYVYTLINQKRKNKEVFSPTALAVLDKATEILIDTFGNRSEFNDLHREYQVNNWDAGWYQIKQLAKEYRKKEYKEFRELFIQFRKELEPLVYELGFLKQ